MMIWCGYVQNFLANSLPVSLSTCEITLSTLLVNTYFLISNRISSLSTFLFSGAKLLSLYLFRIKKSGKFANNPVFYAFYPLYKMVVTG